MDNLEIKSPVFKSEPGWGGQLKNWLSRNGWTLFVLLWLGLLFAFLFAR